MPRPLSSTEVPHNVPCATYAILETTLVILLAQREMQHALKCAMEHCAIPRALQAFALQRAPVPVCYSLLYNLRF